jgi:hypothetical protein
MIEGEVGFIWFGVIKVVERSEVLLGKEEEANTPQEKG